MTVLSMHVPPCVKMQAHVKHPGACVECIGVCIKHAGGCVEHAGVCVEHAGVCVEHAGVCVEHAISISLLLKTMIETFN